MISSQGVEETASLIFPISDNEKKGCSYMGMCVESKSSTLKETCISMPEGTQGRWDPLQVDKKISLLKKSAATHDLQNKS